MNGWIPSANRKEEGGEASHRVEVEEDVARGQGPCLSARAPMRLALSGFSRPIDLRVLALAR